MSRNTTKPQKLGMEKLAVVFAVLLFLFPLVLGMFGVQSFLLGVLCEAGILILLVYALWVWEGTHGIEVVWKMASSLVIVVLIVGVLWRPAKNQWRREHPSPVLAMHARITGPYGPGVSETNVVLEIENPPAEAIENVDLTIATSKERSYPLIQSIMEKPPERQDCKTRPLDIYHKASKSVESLHLKGSDGSSFVISDDDLIEGRLRVHGSPQWKVECPRLAGQETVMFQLHLLENAVNDSLQIDGSYERIPSRGNLVVPVHVTVAIAK